MCTRSGKIRSDEIRSDQIKDLPVVGKRRAMEERVLHCTEAGQGRGVTEREGRFVVGLDRRRIIAGGRRQRSRALHAVAPLDTPSDHCAVPVSLAKQRLCQSTSQDRTGQDKAAQSKHQSYTTASIWFECLTLQKKDNTVQK